MNKRRRKTTKRNKAFRILVVGFHNSLVNFVFVSCLYLYDGNALVGPQANASGTWQNFRAVYHLEEDFKDVSANAHNGVVKAAAAPEPTPTLGKIGLTSPRACAIPGWL
jgi:hypothetical protein